MYKVLPPRRAEGGTRETVNTHLGKIQLHLLPQELCLMQPQPGVRRRQGVAEVYSDTLEALKILEGDVLVIRPEEGFKFGLKNNKRV